MRPGAATALVAFAEPFTVWQLLQSPEVCVCVMTRDDVPRAARGKERASGSE